jgi:predicted amidohydrolase
MPAGVCFGIAERATDGRPYITQVFAAAGRVAAMQRKRHLGEGEEAFTPGTESVACEHAGGSFGIVICAEAGYDGPFDAAASAGAGLILFPAAPGLTGRRTDEDFPGLAALVRPDGSVAARLPDWQPGVLVVDVPTRH